MRRLGSIEVPDAYSRYCTPVLRSVASLVRILVDQHVLDGILVGGIRGIGKTAEGIVGEGLKAGGRRDLREVARSVDVHHTDRTAGGFVREDMVDATEC